FAFRSRHPVACTALRVGAESLSNGTALACTATAHYSLVLYTRSAKRSAMSHPDETTEVGKQAGIQVIARAAAIMRVLGNNPQGLSLAAIAQLVELPRSMVQRIINALVDEFMVESSGPSGGFRLGPALGHLINQTQCDIISLTKSRLAELAGQLQESVCLCRRVGDKVHVIDRIVAERELRVVFPIGVHASVL